MVEIYDQVVSVDIESKDTLCNFCTGCKNVITKYLYLQLHNIDNFKIAVVSY